MTAGQVVFNGHERSIKPQVSRHVASSAILDVEEITGAAQVDATEPVIGSQDGPC
jgi:hypothetical protein